MVSSITTPVRAWRDRQPHNRPAYVAPCRGQLQPDFGQQPVCRGRHPSVHPIQQSGAFQVVTWNASTRSSAMCSPASVRCQASRKSAASSSAEPPTTTFTSIVIASHGRLNADGHPCPPHYRSRPDALPRRRITVRVSVDGRTRGRNRQFPQFHFQDHPVFVDSLPTPDLPDL
jgi:hypothetical protein